MKTFQLRDGRQAHDFPWTNSQIAQPWKQGYHRVIIPFTEKELATAKPGKTCHIQIVRNDKLQLVEN